MARSLSFIALLIGTAAAMLPPAVGAQQASPLAGGWTLNRAQSELPQAIGFNAGFMPPPTGGSRGSGSSADGRGRGAQPFGARPESYDDARRAQVVLEELRNPPTRLVITDAAGIVTMTNDLGQSRTLHPDGRQESIEIQRVPIAVTARRDADQLVVTYRVDPNREVRYTYSATTTPARLVVEAQVLEHGAGDKARRVYDTGTVETLAAAAAPAPSPPGGAPSGGAPPPGSAPAPPAPDTFDQRPGAELKGLRRLGLVVEALSAQSTACGLNADAIETAVSKRLTAGGLTVRANSDDDTYVYVNVITSTLPNNLCVTRYDAFLYTNATAKVSYRNERVLVQASLLHRGGMATGVRPDLGAAVVRGLEEYMDRFVTEIRDANK